ncbi:MAG: hypothetical protein MR451_03855 [Clostridiales bacterium]|nr:hypothetical protein [Clostridiales bacterium]
MMTHKLSRWAPPGFPLRTELQFFGSGMFFAALYSALFLHRYFIARNDLYETFGTSRVLRPDAVMPDFIVLLGGFLLGFAVLALCMAGFALYHYLYHWQGGSKSIYLMRRLPDRWELHRRCLTLPLAGAVLCGLAALLLFCLYFILYMTATPADCLTPGQWQKVWSVI